MLIKFLARKKLQEKISFFGGICRHFSLNLSSASSLPQIWKKKMEDRYVTSIEN